MSHKEPVVGDEITVYRREERDLNPDGEIVDVNESCEEVTVQYKGDDVRWEGDWIVFNGFRTYHRHVRIGGILHHSRVATEQPEMLYASGETETFTFDELHRRWSSRDGGQGRWIIQD